MNALDREEFRIKLEEINKLIEKKDYEKAMEIVDSIDWRKVKNIRTLCVVGEIYAANKRYGESKEIFLLAYHRAPIGKTILYRLIEISLRMGDIREAEEFYEEYKKIAPNDTSSYVLQYKILRVKKAPIQQQIEILEEYKEKEFTEKWSFELARLYYKAGENEKSLEVCDDLILWFSEGKYVLKALDLKMRMGAISKAEKERYEREFIPKLTKPDEAAAAAEEKQEKTEADKEDIEKIEPDQMLIPQEERNLGGIAETTGAIQEKIARGIKDIFSGIHKERKEDDLFSQTLEDDFEESKPEKESIKEEIKPEEKPEKESVQTGSKGYQFDPNKKVSVPMPEMKMPGMIKIPGKIETPKAKVIPEFVMPDEDTLKNQEAAKEKESQEDLNLEDIILAAASEQGIEIESEKPDSEEKVEVFDDLETEEESDQEFKEESFKEEVSIEEPEWETVSEEITEDEKVSEVVLEETEEEETEITRETEEDTAAEEAGQIFEEESLVEEIEEAAESDDKTDDGDLDQDDEEDSEDVSLEEETPFMDYDPEEEAKFLIADEQEEESSSEIEENSAEAADEENEQEEVLSDEPQEDQDITPREMKFDDEEEKLFSYFVKVPGMKEQILEALLDVQLAASDKTSKTGNVIVMGNKGCGKTRLIQGFIPAVCRELNIPAAKVAYVYGDELNGQDIAKIVDKLSSGFLVIEQANQMNADTIEELNKAMDFRTDGLTVIMEDEKIGMRKLIAKYPKMAAKFTSMINIPVFTNDELVAFAKVYTKENGYVIDQMGILALYNLIGSNQKEDEPMTIQAVKQMVDTAVDKAESGARKLKRNLSKKRTDPEGRIVLYEKDFS